MRKMCGHNWGYQRLHEAVEKRARQEMQHAEELITRIIFLEGTPTVSRLNQIHVGADVSAQLQADLQSSAQRSACSRPYLTDEADDAATRALLESILNDEDGHVDLARRTNGSDCGE